MSEAHNSIGRKTGLRRSLLAGQDVSWSREVGNSAVGRVAVLSGSTAL